MEALEAEKQKIAEEIHTLQKNHGSGNKAVMSMYMHDVTKAMLASLSQWAWVMGIGTGTFSVSLIPVQ